MFNKLHIRIIAGLGAMLMLFGVASQMIQQSHTMACIQEVHQKMHYDLASKLVENWLENEGPKLTKGRVSGIFKEVLDANPQLAIYLLDADGNIVCSSTPEELKADSVNLRPVSSFISDASTLPIYGADPRNTEMQCLFSAAPISREGKTIGYLYVLLEGAGGRSINNLIAESDVMWVSISSTVIGLLLVMAVGTMLVTRSTSRLRALADQLDAFHRGGFTRADSVEKPRNGNTDDINHLQDVSRQMAEKISVQIRELQQAGEFRRELVTNVGHDLRTPLASLQGYLESIQLKNRQLNSEEREKYLGVALKNAKRLSAIVEEMNELSRLDSGDIGLKREPVALPDVLNDVLLTFHDQLKNRGINLKTHVPQNLANISGDPHLLTRAFANLASHVVRSAIDDAKLNLSVRKQDDLVEVVFTDPNRVIPEQELSLLFNRFYQEKDNPDAKNGGAGLAISDRIISLHGGSIRAESDEEHGTVITVILPKN